MQISGATAKDKVDWLPLWQGYLTFYKQPLADDITDLTFARILDPAFPLHMLVAKEAGQMLGFSTYIFHPSTWSRSGYCYLEDLFVAEAARGAGVGRALIEAVASSAKASGAERLYWITDSDNKKAQALYQTLATRPDVIQFRRDL